MKQPGYTGVIYSFWEIFMLISLVTALICTLPEEQMGPWAILNQYLLCVYLIILLGLR